LTSFVEVFGESFNFSLAFVGSGFRVQCVKDSEFQNGVVLDLQLGSKSFSVRVPYDVLSVKVSGGRLIEINAFKTPNTLNWVE
jgi:ribosomal protein L6P/L9E